MHHLHFQVSPEDGKIGRTLIVVPGIYDEHMILAVLVQHLTEILGASVNAACPGTSAHTDLLYLGMGVIGMQNHQVLGTCSGNRRKNKQKQCRCREYRFHFHNCLNHQ